MPSPAAVRPALPRVVLGLLLVIALALGLTVVDASAQSVEQNQLTRAKQRVAEIANQIDGAESRAEAAAGELALADAQLAEVEAAVNEAAAAIERQEGAVAEAAARLIELDERSAELREAFSERAAEIYKNGSGLPFEIVLTSGDIDDALARSAFLRVITAADRATLEGINNSQVNVQAQRDRYEAEHARLEEMKAEQDELLQQVAAIRRSKALAAASARAEVEALKTQRDELQADQQRLEHLIATNRVTPVSSSAPSTSGYAWPRCDRVTSEYGRRWGRLHAGLDIDGNTGDPIYASKAGVVIFAGWQGGYGRLTLIDHGDGVVTAYAHQTQQSAGKGQQVERGQRIGSVGSTGNSTGSHLHFETRVNGSAVNPRRFLPSGC